METENESNVHPMTVPVKFDFDRNPDDMKSCQEI